MPLPVLNAVEARVLGALMEKETTTPEYYPLSLNALEAACNQKSSRDPVMQLTEDDLRPALHALQDGGIVSPVHEGRVVRYENRIRTILNLRRDENALLYLLLLRGPQTPGELRSRADRLFTFHDLSAVTSALARMAEREEALVKLLSRQPGMKEARYAHLLSGEVVTENAADMVQEICSAPRLEERLARLETEVAELRERLAILEGDRSSDA